MKVHDVEASGDQQADIDPQRGDAGATAAINTIADGLTGSPIIARIGVEHHDLTVAAQGLLQALNMYGYATKRRRVAPDE